MIIVNIITILVSSPLVSMMAHSLLLVAEVVLLPGVEVAVLRTVARAVRPGTARSQTASKNQIYL